MIYDFSKINVVKWKIDMPRALPSGVEKAVGVAILRRRQFYAHGQFRGLPGPWSTPITPTFGRRYRRWPSAYCAIPVVQ
jgi:hypothetical protein